MPHARTKLITAVACAVGAAAGVLTYLASRSLPQTMLAVGTGTSGAVHLLSQIFDNTTERDTNGQDNDDIDQREK